MSAESVLTKGMTGELDDHIYEKQSNANSAFALGLPVRALIDYFSILIQNNK